MKQHVFSEQIVTDIPHSLRPLLTVLLPGLLLVGSVVPVPGGLLFGLPELPGHSVAHGADAPRADAPPADAPRADEHPEQQPAPDLASIVNNLREWQAAFKSLRLTIRSLDRQEMQNLVPSFPSDSSLQDDQWGQRMSLWYEGPFRFWFDHESLSDGHPEIRHTGAVNGFRYWNGYSGGDNSRYTHLEVMPLYPVASPQVYMLQAHPLRDHCRLVALEGLWNEDRCCWLADWIMEERDVRAEGFQDFDGHRCVLLISHKWYAGPIGRRVKEQWWLDPDKQFLPRRFLRSESQPNAADDDTLDTEWTVHDFRQVTESFWFPASGVFTREFIRGRSGRRGVQTYEWLVREVQTDQALPEERLSPPEPTMDTVLYANEFDSMTPRWFPGAAPSARSLMTRPPERERTWMQDPTIIIPLSVFAAGGGLIVLQGIWRQMTGTSGRQAACRPILPEQR